MSLRGAGLSNNDELALNSKGIRVYRFRGRTSLQLIARGVDQKILAMVEARSADPATDQPGTAAIRQIRTGVLLWNQGNDDPNVYLTASGREEQPFALTLWDGESEPWRVLRRGDPSVSDEYPSFDEAILGIGQTVDVQVAAERAARLRTFESALAAEDVRWANEAVRQLARNRPDVPGLGL